MVGPGALDVALAILYAAPKVAAADNDAHLNTHLHAFLNDIRHPAHNAKVQAKVLFSRQGFPADFQQHPFIFRLVHTNPPVFILHSILQYFPPFVNEIFAKGGSCFSSLDGYNEIIKICHCSLSLRNQFAKAAAAIRFLKMKKVEKFKK